MLYRHKLRTVKLLPGCFLGEVCSVYSLFRAHFFLACFVFVLFFFTYLPQRLVFASEWCVLFSFSDLFLFNFLFFSLVLFFFVLFLRSENEVTLLVDSLADSIVYREISTRWARSGGRRQKCHVLLRRFYFECGSICYLFAVVRIGGFVA